MWSSSSNSSAIQSNALDMDAIQSRAMHFSLERNAWPDVMATVEVDRSGVADGFTAVLRFHKLRSRPEA